MSFSRMAAKQSPPWSRMRSGKRGSKGLNFRSGRSAGISCVELVQAQHAVDQDDVLRLGVQAARAMKLAQVLGHRGLDLDAHHRAQAALLQPRLELAHQVLGLFLDLHVAVADQAEHALALDLAAGEQLVEEQATRKLSSATNAPLGLAPRRCAAPAAPRSAPTWAGHRHQGVERACRRPAGCSFSAREKPRLGMNGNGCAGSMASGVSTGKMLVERTCSSSRRPVGVGDVARRRPRCRPSSASSARSSRQRRCWSAIRSAASALTCASCSAGRQAVLAERRARPRAPGPSGRRRGPCRIRRGCWRRSTGSAAAPAAGGAGSRSPPAPGRLKASQESSRLKNRAGEAASASSQRERRAARAVVRGMARRSASA